MDLVAVFDVGKTNAKLTGFAPDGTVVAASSVPNAPVRGAPYDHADVEMLWAFLLDCLSQLAREGRVGDIVPTTHGATAALVDGDGLTVPVMDYEWPGVAAFADYEAVRPPFRETGSPLLPGGLNIGRQLHYLARAHPEAFARTKWILPYPQYWAWRLCGLAASDASSLGAHSDLWDYRARSFSSLVRNAGWAARMGPVRPAGDVLGPVRPEVAAAAGLPREARVRTGIHDSNASLLPFLGAAGGEPFALVSSGTWAIVFAVGGALDRLDERRDCLVNVDANADPVPSARIMAGREFAIIVGDEAEAASLADALAVIEAGAMLLPGFVPGVGPFGWREGEGLDDPRLAEPRARRAAASLYVALVLAESLELAGARGRILIDGPLARDPIVPAALRTLTGRAVVALTGSDSSSGALRLASGRPLDPPAGRTVMDELPPLRAYRRAWRDRIGAA